MSVSDDARAAATLKSERYLISKWETADGLPENSATAIAQSPEGYLWIGTFNGLVRFDGVRFEVFNTANTPELPNNAVVNLHRDVAGRLWFSTYRGLMTYQDGRWTLIGKGTSWTNRIVRSFAENRSGLLYAASFDGMVCRLSGSQLIELPPPPGANPSSRCYVDPAGTAWVIGERIVSRWSGTNWLQQTELSESTREFESLVVNSEGALVILGRNALSRLNNGKLERSIHLSQSIDSIWSAMQTRDGTIWAASFRHGLYRIDPRGQVEHLTEADGLTQNALRCAFQDREDNLWVGSSGGGLMLMRPRIVWTFDSATTLPNRVVKSLWEEAPGRLLVATYGGNAVRMQGRTVAPLLEQTPGFNYAQCVRTDRAGRIWIGSYGDGVAIQDGTGRPRVFRMEAGGENISALWEDSAGRMWIGGNEGVAYHDADGFHRAPESGGAPVRAVTCFAENPVDGSIWAVSPTAGLHRFADGRGTPVEGPGGRPMEGQHLMFEPNQTLWVATESSGLLRWRKGAWSRVTSREGLVTDSISSILTDDRDHVWLTSNRGIMRTSLRSLHAAADGLHRALELSTFTAHDGLLSAECPAGFQPNAIRDSQGQFWFATLKGVAMIDPATVTTDTNPPPVLIESLRFVDRDGQRRNRALRSGEPATVSIPAGSTEIEIAFTALSLRAPEKVRFVHELRRHGQVLNHLETAQRHFAFPLLPPGDYEFAVSAANADGVESVAPATFHFSVRPFFWQTNWFRWLAAFALVGGGGGSAWRVFNRRLLQQKAAHEQERVLAEQKARLASVLESTTDFVGFAAPDGRALYVNPAGRRLIGCRPEEDVSQLRIRDFHPPARADYVESVALPHAIEHGTWSGENVLRRVDGSEVPVSQVIVAHQDNRGQTVFYSTIARDISEQRKAEQALRVTEEALRAFMNALPEPALMLDREGTVIMINEALPRSLGRSPADVLGRNIYQLLPAEIARKRKEAIDSVLATGRPASFEDSRDGKHFINYMSPIPDADGKPRRVAVFALDISDREQAEELLKSLLAGTAAQSGTDFFRSLVKGLAQAFGVKYAFVGELMSNQTRVRAISVWAGDAPGEPFEYDLAHTPCAEVVQGSICLHREGVQDLFPEDVLLREMKIESYMGAPLYDKSGRPLGILVVLHDKPLVESRHHQSIFSIFASRAGGELERLRAEEALRTSETRLRAIVHNTPNVAVQGFNLRGEVTLWNDASTRMFGWSANEALGHTVDQLFFSADEAAAFQAILHQIVGTGRAVGPEEYHFRRRSGEDGWFLSTLFEIPGLGAAPMFVCMNVDVTARKSAEQDLRELAGRLMEVQDEERRRIGRELHDSTGQGLAALEINLAMARRAFHSTTPALQQLLDDCMTLAAQCSNEIRTTSYLLHPPLLDEIGLASAIKWLADGFSRRSQIQVRLELPERFERLAPDVELALFRLVQEALTNVHRHSRSTAAEISLQTRERVIVVEVRDFGVGIAAPELLNFRQGGTALGVGLAGMRHRLRQLGGTLEIESRSGATIVTATVPTASPATTGTSPAVTEMPSRGTAAGSHSAARPSSSPLEQPQIQA